MTPAASGRPLEGRTALVTGAGRGIGRATAIALAQAGAAAVVLVARSATQLEEAAADVESAGARALVLTADLGASPDDVVDLAERAGAVDILVNNAATVAPLGPTSDLPADDVLTAFALNVVAPVLLAGRLAPRMVAGGWGRIVNVSSGAARNPASAIGSGVYAATKSALEAHTLSLAAELAGTGVTVNAYRPGIVDTSMQQWVRDQDPDAIGRDLHARFVESHREGRLLTPERSAAALVTRLTRDETGGIWDVADPV